MVEVIKNNYVPPFPKIVYCANCKSVLKINSPKDLSPRGSIRFCPCCKENNAKVIEVEMTDSMREELLSEKKNIFKVEVNE